MSARFREYTAFHRTPGNELSHFIGVPLIIIGSGGLLALVSLGSLAGVSVTLTELVLLAIAAFYVIEARALGAITAIAVVAFGELGRWLPLPFAIVLFVLGWAVQFLGHALFEKRSPAFLGNLLHLLVGPAWLVRRILLPRAATSDLAAHQAAPATATNRSDERFGT